MANAYRPFSLPPHLPQTGDTPFPNPRDVPQRPFMYPIHMNEQTPHPNQNSITLAGLLFLTHFTAGATAVFLHTLLHNLEPIARALFAFAGGGGMGLLLTLNLQRTIRALDWALLHLLTSLPVPPLPKRSPLAGLMAKANLLADRERPLAQQRQSQLQQAEEAAAQQERNRLARDLHDSIKQQLFSIQISAAAAEARLATDPDGAMAAIADVRGSGKAAMVEMNALLHQLAPAPLEKVGLEQALREQAEALGYRSGAAVTVHIAPLPPADQIPIGSEEAIFRIAQEGLSNVARHARATAVSLHLTSSPDALTLIVHDDGQGFDPIAPHSGMGLDNMTRRAEKLGGEVTIESRKGGGSTIQAVIPLDSTTELKEQIMYKPTQTLNKIGLIGIGGGLVVTAVLIHPLYVHLPSLFISGWMDGSTVLASLFSPLALFAAIATGYFAAKQTGVATRKGGAGVGAVAGGIAGLIIYATLGSAAAAIIGSRHLLARGFAPVESEIELIYWLSDAVNGSIWWIFSSFFIILAGGALLGGISGAIAPPTTDREALPDWRELNSLFPVIAVVGLLSATFSLVMTIAVFVLLGEVIMENSVELEATGYGLQLPAVGSQIWPLATPMLIYLLMAGAFFGALLAGRRATARTEQQEYAMSAYVGGLTMMGLPILTANIILSAIESEVAVLLHMGWTAVNLAMTLAALWLAQKLLTRFSNATSGWRSAADWGLMGTAVIVAALSVTSMYGVAALLWLAGVIFFIIPHSHNFSLPREEQRPFAEKISRGLSILVPSVLAFILPTIPFMAGSIGIGLPIIPSIEFLSAGINGGPLPAAEVVETAVITQIQQLYSLNWLILFFPLIFSLALVGIFFAIAKFAAKIKN